jgi:hypothetical protein
MPKLDINQVAEILKRNELEPALLRQIVEEMNLAAQPEVNEEPAPTVKKQFSVILSDPTGCLEPFTDVGLVAWVVQIAEEHPVTSTLERIHRAAYEFNTTKKGRLLPAKTLADAIENIPAKHHKEAGVWVKTKTPVFVLRTDGQIPMEKTDRKTRLR